MGDEIKKMVFMKSQERIIQLDYIRAFAILCVIITHVTEMVYTLNSAALIQETVNNRVFSVSMFTVGRLGVPLFFFLTGFLMSGGIRI
jgi:peptidoglycan/LPS O-acetylase OafA/YrhL